MLDKFDILEPVKGQILRDYNWGFGDEEAEVKFNKGTKVIVSKPFVGEATIFGLKQPNLFWRTTWEYILHTPDGVKTATVLFFEAEEIKEDKD